MLSNFYGRALKLLLTESITYEINYSNRKKVCKFFVSMKNLIGLDLRFNKMEILNIFFWIKFGAVYQVVYVDFNVKQAAKFS